MITVEIKDMQDRFRLDREFIRRVVRGALKRESRSGEVSVVLAGDEYVKELNRKFRSVNRTTDVLAFPMNEERLLGDIVVSVDRAKEQAVAYKQSFKREMARLIIHGVLHLLGYPDGSSRNRRKMQERQEEILKDVLS